MRMSPRWKRRELIVRSKWPDGRSEAKEAVAAEAELSTKLREQLRQASWTSFNEAELLFGLVEWRKGIAHLARAITFDPQNPVPAERLFEEPRNSL